MTDFNCIILLGATATGKTRLAVRLASELDGEIISADSRQVFRGMDIGTGKDLNEYQIETVETVENVESVKSLENNTIKHYLINILEAGEKYNVDAFKKDFSDAFSVIQSKGKLPIICGGTGMYIHSLLVHQPFTAIPVNESLRQEMSALTKEELMQRFSALEEKRLAHTDISSAKRLIRALEIGEFLKYNEVPKTELPKIKPLIFGLKSEVSQTREAIRKRLEQRFSDGLIQEVEGLLLRGISHDTLVYYGLEYKFISEFLQGAISFEELNIQLFTAICQFAKRQNTFFRKMEKDGININWLDAALPINELQTILFEKLYQ